MRREGEGDILKAVPWLTLDNEVNTLCSYTVQSARRHMSHALFLSIAVAHLTFNNWRDMTFPITLLQWIGVAAKIEEHTKRVKQLVDLGRLADRERDAERVREKRRERKMKYEKNSKDGEKGGGKVAVLGSSGEAAAYIHHGGNNEDDDEDADNGSVDEYGNNKYIKGAYEAHGEDSDDHRDPRIVNEYSDDEEEEEEEVVRKPVKKQKVSQKKNSKRSRVEVESDKDSDDDDDDSGQGIDLKEQEEQVLKMLRTA